jgi:hypothetical protein
MIVFDEAIDLGFRVAVFGLYLPSVRRAGTGSRARELLAYLLRADVQGPYSDPYFRAIVLQPVRPLDTE